MAKTIPEMALCLAPDERINWFPEREASDCFTPYDRCPQCGSETVPFPGSDTGLRACVFCLSRDYIVREYPAKDDEYCGDTCEGLSNAKMQLKNALALIQSMSEECDDLRHRVLANDDDIMARDNENRRLKADVDKLAEMLRKRGVSTHSCGNSVD